ncbi:hypothetical protein SAMN05421812_10689 [Asanoa hainanensis]|uniref:Uncharacterized protein n=1 Tax=Asanoa hainanensis TaxID=560556 RepID=A0A239MPR1_9ACTN|nr:hypothetical protein [Asanoa hainanensis]SNT44233.1 hypothetical protein SAMN05421812_10689 [Asanoa hainanensis]
MLNILASNAGDASPSFQPAPRAADESNLDWLGRELTGHGTQLLLIGARDHIGFRLRVAQAHLRHDLTPSHWSHAALLGSVAGAGTLLYEVSLDPPRGFGVPTAANALQVGRLSAYADADRFRNIALLRLPVPAEQWQGESTSTQISVLDRFRKQRSVLDVTELVPQWLAFCWGVGRAANPLLDPSPIAGAWHVGDRIGTWADS